MGLGSFGVVVSCLGGNGGCTPPILPRTEELDSIELAGVSGNSSSRSGCRRTKSSSVIHASLTDQDREVINYTQSKVKNNSELTNLMKISRIEGYKKIRVESIGNQEKILMISSNLIKSDNESIVEIGENCRL